MIAVDSPVTINHPAKSGIAPLILAAALGAALPFAWAGILSYFTPSPGGVVDTDTDTRYVIEPMPGE